LLVDDAASVRSRVSALCGDVPGVARVLEAEGVLEAIALLRRERPRVVVLDLHLRQESGFALLEHVKRERLDVTVIVLTNDASEHHRRRCAALGASYFFDKSSEFEAVLPVLAELAARCA
jgi:DNA-binding NarL/FixJ family response regulator